MNEAYAQDFFVANRWLLRCAGLWAPKSRHKIIPVLYKLYGIAIFLFVNVFFTITEFASLSCTYGNEYDLIKNLSIALTHLMGAVKVVFFYFKGHKLLEIMDTLENKEFHYNSCPRKRFFPGLISKRYKRAGIKYTVFFFMLALATLFSSYIPPIISTLMYNNPQHPERQIIYKLPYYSWMPFKYNSSETFLMALGYHFIPMLSYAYSIVGMDTLFMNILNIIGFNLTMIQGAFLTIRSRVVGQAGEESVCKSNIILDSEEVKLKLSKEMKRICRHLQIIYRVCEDLENVHKYLTLAQMTATLFILCSCLYLVSSTPISKQFYSEIVYMMAIGFQLILYCWFGNEVTLKAAELPLYIWQCDWLTADNNFKKNMILTMARAKRPLYLTAGKFAPLTLATFVSIIKGSYSFFTVLKSTHENEMTL